MLEQAGLHHDMLMEQYNVRGLVLGHVEMDFSSTARFGDVLDLETKISKIGGASFEISHTMKT